MRLFIIAGSNVLYKRGNAFFSFDPYRKVLFL